MECFYTKLNIIKYISKLRNFEWNKIIYRFCVWEIILGYFNRFNIGVTHLAEGAYYINEFVKYSRHK